MLQAIASFFSDMQVLFLKRDLLDRLTLLATFVGLFGTPAVLVAASWRRARRHLDRQRAAELQERKTLARLVTDRDILITELKNSLAKIEPERPAAILARAAELQRANRESEAIGEFEAWVAAHGPEVGRMMCELALHHLGLALIDPVSSSSELNRFANLANLLLPDDNLAARILAEAQALTGEQRPSGSESSNATHLLTQLDYTGGQGQEARAVVQRLMFSVSRFPVHRYPGANLALLQRAISIGEPALGAYDNDVLIAKDLRAQVWEEFGDNEKALSEVEDVVMGFSRQHAPGELSKLACWWHRLSLRDKLGQHLLALTEIDIELPLRVKANDEQPFWQNKLDIDNLRYMRWDMAKKAGLDPPGEKPLTRWI